MGHKFLYYRRQFLIEVFVKTADGKCITTDFVFVQWKTENAFF